MDRAQGCPKEPQRSKRFRGQAIPASKSRVGPKVEAAVRRSLRNKPITFLMDPARDARMDRAQGVPGFDPARFARMDRAQGCPKQPNHRRPVADQNAQRKSNNGWSSPPRLPHARVKCETAIPPDVWRGPGDRRLPCPRRGGRLPKGPSPAT